MKTFLKPLLIITCILLVSFVQSSISTAQESNLDDLPISALDMQSFNVISKITLDSDGKDSGHSAYDLIREFGGPRSIESPDLFEGNHRDVIHITEDSDEIIGDHFVFLSHRDIDRDRGKMHITDRQRNEIKTYDRSIDALKGFENETLVYQWKFKINEDMEVSKGFSHFFQLKAKGGNDKMPIITITGSERGRSDGIEVRHNSGKTDKGILQRTAWEAVTGEWIDVYCRVTFADSASIRLIAKRISDGKVIFDIDQSNLDIWRGTNAKHFVRPKWGIYRSLRNSENLRAEEENVRFANFSVSKVVPK